MPAWKSRFLREAIASIVGQTCPDWELVVVDDCSPEPLQAIVAEFSDPRIRYERNAHNIGGSDLVAQWNHCLDFAKGEYVVMAGDDDRYRPEFCAECLRLADKYPQVDVIHASVQPIDEKGRLNLSRRDALIEVEGLVPENNPAPRGGSRHSDGGRRPSGTPARVGVHNRPGGPAHHAPSHREFNGRPAHFHVRGPHHYGHYIPGPPPRYKLYHYWGRDYYYYDNIWYRYYGGRYWICRPPWGYVFSPLADAVFTACEFAYYFDRIHYYNSVSENAQTIAAQNEAIAANNAVLASQNEAIARNTAAANAAGDLASSLGLVQSYANAGIEYYYNDGVFYVKDADGQYTVIVPPAGALVETLPEDYEIVTLGGKEYYKVDDTIYRMVVIDNKAMFEVLGQLVS